METTANPRREEIGRLNGVAPLPPVFLNTVPKSGTHLVKQILSGFPGLSHSEQDEFYGGYPRQIEEQRARLSQIGAGRLAAGHVYFSEAWSRMIDEFGFKHVFVYRDPRDVVVSLTHFYTYMLPDHIGYRHLNQCLHTDRDRFRAIITGFEHDGIDIPDVATWYRRFVGWLKAPGTLCITFEDLIRSRDSQRSVMQTVVRHLCEGGVDHEDNVINAMQDGINPATSRTFRRGEIGSWRDELDPLNKTLLKAVAGDLLIELGYETAYDW